MADINPMLEALRPSDAAARRGTGAYGAQTYDVQNSGPSVMDTLGLLGFVAGGPVGPATGKIAGQLGSAAQKGTDWARARLFEHFSPGFNHAAAAQASDLIRPLLPTGAWINEPYKGWRPAGLEGFTSLAPDAPTFAGGSLQQMLSKPMNDTTALAPETQQYLNAMLRQRGPDLTVIPGRTP